MKKRVLCGLFLLILSLFFLCACVPKCPQGQEFVDGACADIKKEGKTIEETDKVEEKTVKDKNSEEKTLKENASESSVKKTKEFEVNEVSETEKMPKPEVKTERADSVILDELKRNYENNVKNFEFYFGGIYYTVYKLSDSSSGDLIKVLLDKADYLKNFKVNNKTVSTVLYDVIYVNESDKSVVAYCEGIIDKEAKIHCVEEFIFDAPFKLSYSLYDSKYKVTLPSEILYSLFNAGVNIKRVDENKYNIKNMAVTLVETGNKILYLNPSSGLPVKIELIDREPHQVVLFDNLFFNKAKLIEMTHRSKSEIPSEETFHS